MDPHYHLYSQESIEDANPIKKGMANDMKPYFINELELKQCESEIDVAFALCESYRKEIMMGAVYIEGATTPAVDPNVPAADASQPNGGQAQGSVKVGNVQLNGNIVNRLIEALTKIVEKLSESIGNVVTNAMNEQAEQANTKTEDEIEQLKQQAQSDGKIDLSNPENLDQFVQQIAQEDPNDQLTDEQKKLMKCVLVGDFSQCEILGSKNVQSLTDVNTMMKDFVDIIKKHSNNPENLANAISAGLKGHNEKLAQIIGNSTAANYSGQSTTQMSWKQFRENEKIASAQLKQANQYLKIIDQSFKTGGIKGFFDFATKRDLKADKITDQAFKDLQNALGLIRKSLAKITTDIQAVRKVNKKLINRLRTICVGGNKSVEAFAKRGSSQKLGVQTRYTGKADKGKFENIQSPSYNQFNAINANALRQ